MPLNFRNCVKIILLNDENEMLLMCAKNPKFISIYNKKYHKNSEIFWYPVGGKIEDGESIEDATIREIYEETGLLKEELTIGPMVWFGEFDYLLNDKMTTQKETYLVVKTKQKKVSLTNLDGWEKQNVEKIEWFSYEKIKNCKDVIFPILLIKYLPDIISEKYPEKPIRIDLTIIP